LEGEKMSDFFQNGEIATFHRLKQRDLRELEGELEEATKSFHIFQLNYKG
jgi:hypothetical protein